MEPLVSVILTVYKRTEYLKEAISGVLNQSEIRYEIIVSDDSNCEEIKKISETFQNPRIKYRCNKTNLGVAQNVRSAINEARGTFITILNDDDYWKPDFLEKLLLPLKNNPEIVMAFCNHWLVNEVGIINKQATEDVEERYGRSILKAGELSNWKKFAVIQNGVPLAMASIFRKDALPLECIFPETKGAYDYWISCLLAKTGGLAYFVSERLTCYRIHNTMETGRKSVDKRLNMVFIFQTLLLEKYFPEFQHELREKLLLALENVGIDHLKFNDTQKARGYFLKVIFMRFRFKSVMGLMLTLLPKFVLPFTLSKENHGL